MNVAPMPHPGARVQVLWTDGRVYPATVTALAQGMAQIRWDTGGAPAWVPLHVVSPLMAAPAGQPVRQPSVAPAMQWQPHPQYAKPEPAPAAAPAAAKPAETPAQPAQQPAATPKGPAPAMRGRPMKATIRDLPRGYVYEPTGKGPGDGKSFFVLFGFVATADIDTAMRMTDIDHLGDDVAAMCAAGYCVIVDLHGDLDALNSALSGLHPEAPGLLPAGVFWSGHGDTDGTIATYDGGWIAPESIAADVAQKGTVKLFVMSACHAGGHAPRWQKALGKDAQIIGWGAPITNERAIEFLVPDDKNAKGFDDLLEKHLGVRRVTADGPLAEVKELALKHEDRIATMNLTLEELIEAATKKLKCRMDKGKTGDVYYLEIKTPPSKDYPNIPRSQLVRVSSMGAGDAWVYVSSIVGPYSDALDLARGLRALTPAIHIRLSLSKLTPPDQEFIMIETIMRRRRLDPHSFSNNLIAIAVNADKLEDLYFGSDKR